MLMPIQMPNIFHLLDSSAMVLKVLSGVWFAFSIRQYGLDWSKTRATFLAHVRRLMLIWLEYGWHVSSQKTNNLDGWCIEQDRITDQYRGSAILRTGTLCAFVRKSWTSSPRWNGNSSKNGLEFSWFSILRGLLPNDEKEEKGKMRKNVLKQRYDQTVRIVVELLLAWRYIFLSLPAFSPDSIHGWYKLCRDTNYVPIHILAVETIWRALWV